MAKQAGRPAKYTDKLALEVCRRLSKGESLKSITDDKKMPDDNTVFKWIHEDTNGFRDKYEKAKQESSDAFAEKMLDIVVNVKEDTAAIAKARLHIDALKWLMSKHKPKKYGDKLDLTSGGEKLPTPIYGGKSGDDSSSK